MNTLGLKRPEKRRVRRSARGRVQIFIAAFGLMVFGLSAILDDEITPDYLSYFLNPVKVMVEPLPITQQEQNWRIHR
ncbi:hypothetical protein [Pleionea mediterranea]|jgi:hypothetical protein|uniref:Uncharacterized protein n=1 Tax=Pleionea mediterranea TaxID=523701 RepID=A0A316G1J6_9GAMM|nr:hypothetical protein [Pleionea mediterranea]PWK54493.1 hypothetical protein C8D97_101347 [Pleionea mediterranea]